MSKHGYCNKVTIEAVDPDGDVYQRMTFEQFYNDNGTQIAEAQEAFPKVAEAVMSAAAEFGAK